MYTEKVLKHFRQPHNYGRIKNPDGTGKVGNIICGDVMWLYLKIGKNKRGEDFISIIKDIKKWALNWRLSKKECENKDCRYCEF